MQKSSRAWCIGAPSSNRMMGVSAWTDASIVGFAAKQNSSAAPDD
jgi:hypothetical protein